MKINLFYNKTDRVTGCSKVALDTIRGLRELGIDVVENQPGEINGNFHGTPEFRNMTLPNNTLIGPCIIVLPSENKGMYGRWSNFIHPSKWVTEYMKTFPITQHVKHYYWSVGIDAERFKNERGKKFKYDCLVYYKNITKQTPQSSLQTVIKELSNRGMTYQAITYGSYTEAQMIEYSRDCQFCIYLAGTESQGLAIMEMMSMGIPIYVIDCKVMQYQSFRFESPDVSSAPYFSEQCGMKVNGLDFSKLDDFMLGVDHYRPRDYIMENHTLKKGAQKYLNILKEVNGV